MTRSCKHAVAGAFAALALVMASCTHSGNNAPVPRQYAWPRIAGTEADTVLQAIDGTPVPFATSPDAVVTAKPGDVYGLDIAYPQYDAIIYVSFIPVSAADADRVLAARLERIRLNLNGAPSESESTDSSLLVTAKTSAQIPVQLLARRDGYVVSATAVMSSPVAHAHYDSIRPVYDVLSHHLKSALK